MYTHETQRTESDVLRLLGWLWNWHWDMKDVPGFHVESIAIARQERGEYAGSVIYVTNEE